jgi:hypothetical protein
MIGESVNDDPVRRTRGTQHGKGHEARPGVRRVADARGVVPATLRSAEDQAESAEENGEVPTEKLRDRSQQYRTEQKAEN